MIEVFYVHRLPLGFAIAILIFQLVLAIGDPEIFDESIWFTIVLNAIFIIIALVRRANAIEEEKESINNLLAYEKKEVESILNNNNLDDDKKISKIIKLSNEGNSFATLFLKELSKKNE